MILEHKSNPDLMVQFLSKAQLKFKKNIWKICTLPQRGWAYIFYVKKYQKEHSFNQKAQLSKPGAPNPAT